MRLNGGPLKVLSNHADCKVVDIDAQPETSNPSIAMSANLRVKPCNLNSGIDGPSRVTWCRKWQKS